MRSKNYYDKRNYKGTKRRRKKKGSPFLLFVSIVSLWLLYYLNPPWLSELHTYATYDNAVSFLNHFNFRVNSLKSLTQEFITEINEPIVIGDVKTINEDRFKPIDDNALNVQYSGNSVQELATILQKFVSTDEEKARIIYTWITNNIRYDVVALSTFINQNIYPDVTVNTVLTNRQTICSGYANLYQQLAQEMGLKSVIVLGYAKGFDYAVGDDNNVNHAWNAVKINEQWFLLDTTWGAGTINNNRFEQNFNPVYFATNPEHFIYTHFPENIKWQLLSNPYSREMFDNLPTVSHHFFSNNLELVSHKNKHIISNGIVDINLKAPQNVSAIASLQKQGNTVKGDYTFVQRQGDYINVKLAIPDKNDYQLSIFAKQKDDNNNYPFVISYDVRANQPINTQFPLTFSHFTENNGYIESPLSKILQPHQRVYFKLRVNNATEVRVLDKASNRWTTLTRYGNLYTGNVEVLGGEVIVYGKFPNQRELWGLVKYN